MKVTIGMASLHLRLVGRSSRGNVHVFRVVVHVELEVVQQEFVSVIAFACVAMTGHLVDVANVLHDRRLFHSFEEELCQLFICQFVPHPCSNLNPDREEVLYLVDLVAQPGDLGEVLDTEEVGQGWIHPEVVIDVEEHQSSVFGASVWSTPGVESREIHQSRNTAMDLLPLVKA